tara:strand:+ start:264 stop:377 length:114 start_codon:yes stop_codon:yes gene_type:complete
MDLLDQKEVLEVFHLLFLALVEVVLNLDQKVVVVYQF